MDLYAPIFTRASTRKFDTTPVPAKTLEQLESYLATVEPLLPDVKLTHRIVGAKDVKGMALPNAPHYLLIYGKKAPLRDTCAGFFYQHAELYLYSLGLATRWLNSVKGKQADPDFIIGIAFGKPAAPAVRKQSEFDRKPLGEIAKGTDPRLEAVRLAPSGMNGQPWYFIVDGERIHAYYKPSLGGVMGALYHHTDLDLGIALCHLQVASEHEGRPFQFTVAAKDAPPPPQNFVYAGTVK